MDRRAGPQRCADPVKELAELLVGPLDHHDEALVRRTARVLGGAKALSSFEDLGVQMNRSSTLVSYLHYLLIVLTAIAQLH